MKSLEYLYKIKKANDEMGIHTINIDEAIAELEGLQNRSCFSCKHFQNQISETEIACDYMCGFFSIEQKYCGVYEKKENK